jgi:hypothetical protein
VVAAPVLDHHLRLGQAGELLDREQLAADARAEGLDVGVLPRRARLDVGAAGLREAPPVVQRVRRQLRAIVAADQLGPPAGLGEDALEPRDRVVGVDAPRAADLQRRAGELVDDVRSFRMRPSAVWSNWKSSAHT